MTTPPRARKSAPDTTRRPTKKKTRPSSRAAKEAIAKVFEKLGGVSSMVAWVKASPDHEKAFYASIYPKLIPVQLGEKEEPVVTELKVRFY